MCFASDIVKDTAFFVVFAISHMNLSANKLQVARHSHIILVKEVMMRDEETESFRQRRRRG
jgi:hypothetical protein